jgi:transposase-like protein
MVCADCGTEEGVHRYVTIRGGNIRNLCRECKKRWRVKRKEADEHRQKQKEQRDDE